MKNYYFNKSLGMYRTEIQNKKQLRQLTNKIESNRRKTIY